ncbi:hypothetical protein PYCC9005_005282 [Savitreella phatthalungensis]
MQVRTDFREQALQLVRTKPELADEAWRDVSTALCFSKDTRKLIHAIEDLAKDLVDRMNTRHNTLAEHVDHMQTRATDHLDHALTIHLETRRDELSRADPATSLLDAFEQIKEFAHAPAPADDHDHRR